MSRTCAACVLATREDALRLLDRLASARIAAADVSILFPDTAMSKGVRAGDPPALRRLAAIGSIAVPGAGPHLAAGPLMTSLAGTAAGGTVGGVAGALAALGVPRDVAGGCAAKVREGAHLVAVHCDDPAEQSLVQRIFAQCGGKHVAAPDGAALAHRK